MRAVNRARGGRDYALSTKYPKTEPDLAKIIQAWPTVPDYFRMAILALVDTAK